MQSPVYVLLALALFISCTYGQIALMVQARKEPQLEAIKRTLNTIHSRSTRGCKLVTKNIMPSALRRSIEIRRAHHAHESLDELSRYIQVDMRCFNSVDTETELKSLQKKLLSQKDVTAAYISESVPFHMDTLSQRSLRQREPGINIRGKATEKIPQDYLDGYRGHNMRYVRNRPGGKGQNVTIVDIEYGFELKHEDLLQKNISLLFDQDSTYFSNHGSAVLGVITGVDNDFGVTGFAPEATVHAASAFSVSLGIIVVLPHLKAGDIILLESQARGKYCTSFDPSQQCYVPVEWNPADFAAIKLATSMGIIVIEPTGNAVGKQDLDDPIYNIPGEGFPETWKNPFNRSNADSGAIIVAGAGSDRQHIYYTNYGSCVDVQSIGHDIATLGYGDLYFDSSKPGIRNYTDSFGGSSSASACIAGITAVLQGLAKAGQFGNATTLTPAQVRHLYRNSGMPQSGDPSKHIGNRPEFQSLFIAATKLLGGTLVSPKSYSFLIPPAMLVIAVVAVLFVLVPHFRELRSVKL